MNPEVLIAVNADVKVRSDYIGLPHLWHDCLSLRNGVKYASADNEIPSHRPTSDLSASKGPSPVRDLTRIVLGCEVCWSAKRNRNTDRLLSGSSLEHYVMQLKVTQ